MCDQRDDLGDNAEQIISPQFNEADITAIGMTEDNQAELVFSVWISHEDYFLSLLDTYVGEADASLRRVWVRPVRRRSGLATMGLSFAEYAAKEVGIPRLWSLIVHDNMASRRLHEKMGYQLCGRIQLIKLFYKRYVKIHTVWQRVSSRRMLPKGVVRL
jgi:RimJ/RimL family protein N-acetyltransferase